MRLVLPAARQPLGVVRRALRTGTVDPSGTVSRLVHGSGLAPPTITWSSVLEFRPAGVWFHGLSSTHETKNAPVVLGTDQAPLGRIIRLGRVLCAKTSSFSFDSIFSFYLKVNIKSNGQVTYSWS